MNRKQRRAAKFEAEPVESRFGTVTGRFIDDHRGPYPHSLPKTKKPKAEDLPPLTLPWSTPHWAKEDRYREVKFDDASHLIVRPVKPGIHGVEGGLWEVIYNGQPVTLQGQKATFTSLHMACLNAESVREHALFEK